MTRILKLAVIILSIVSLASAQIVDTLNTPFGPVNQGVKVAVSWTLLPGVDATGKTGDLSATDSATKNVVPIDPAVPLAPKSYLWEVNVPPGTYYLGLNDGSGPKLSGEVVVRAGAPPAGGGAPPAAPTSAAPAPAPPASAQVSTADPPAAGSTSSSSPGVTSPTPGSTGSASSIFSGYNVVFSLLGVAIAMVQF